MTIRNKVLSLGIIFLMLIALMLASVLYFSFKEWDRDESENYRVTEMEEIHAHLESLVEIAYTEVENTHRSLQDVEFIQTRYGHRLRNVIDIAFALIEHYAEEAATGETTLAEAQAEALEELERLRYDGGTGYLWVNDSGRPYPRMLMHPTMPELDGKIMDDPRYNGIALNKSANLFTAFVDICAENGEGFVDYIWPKPTPPGLVPDVPKLSYVRLFPKWNWIVGTGIYLDDAERDLIRKLKDNLRKLRYAEGDGYFWVLDRQQPYPTMLVHAAAPEMEGQAMRGGLYDNALHAPGRGLGQAFVEAVAETGEGYVKYDWPRLRHEHAQTYPKLAYLKLYEPLGWIIGTGIYIDEVDAEVEERQAKLAEQRRLLIEQTVIYTGVLFVLSSIVLWLLLTRILRPLHWINRQLQLLAKGVLAEEPEYHYRGHDEIGETLESLELLRKKIQTTIERADAISTGKYDVEFGYLSDQDVLGQALQNMTAALRLATDKNAHQDWLKTGQTRLHGCIQGEQSLLRLSERVLRFFCAYLQAHTGLLYLAGASGSGTEQAPEPRLTASYAFERRRHLANQVRPGERLAGQAILEKQLILIQHRHDDNTDLEAEYVLAIPFFYEDSLKGVLELGFAAQPEAQVLEFLDLIMPDLGIAVQTLQALGARAIPRPVQPAAAA